MRGVLPNSLFLYCNLNVKHIVRLQSSGLCGRAVVKSYRPEV